MIGAPSYSAAAAANRRPRADGTSSSPTHWKQTVLWLPFERRFQGSLNDKVIGTIRYSRRESNDRDYEITLCFKVEKIEDRSVSEEYCYKYFLVSS